jgi:Rab3 GTPase-activating protein regulatory subunit N-terminus
MRTPPPVIKANTRNVVDEDEEITILYHNGKVVSIDGQSLWMVLRVCDGQRESGIGKNGSS